MIGQALLEFFNLSAMIYFVDLAFPKGCTRWQKSILQNDCQNQM